MTLPAGLTRVRVPGKQVASCKRAGADVEPCLLVEAHGEVFLGWEVVFHGSSRIIQSVEAPCPANGAIIWIETEEEVTVIGR